MESKQTIISQVMVRMGWRYFGFDLGWYNADTNCKYSGIDPRYDELSNPEALFVLEEMAKNPPLVSKYDSFMSDSAVPTLEVVFPAKNDPNYYLYWRYDNLEHHCNGTATLGWLSSSDKLLGKAVIQLAAQQFDIGV